MVYIDAAPAVRSLALPFFAAHESPKQQIPRLGSLVGGAKRTGGSFTPSVAGSVLSGTPGSPRQLTLCQSASCDLRHFEGGTVWPRMPLSHKNSSWSRAVKQELPKERGGEEKLDPRKQRRPFPLAGTGGTAEDGGLGIAPQSQELNCCRSSSRGCSRHLALPSAPYQEPIPAARVKSVVTLQWERYFPLHFQELQVGLVPRRSLSFPLRTSYRAVP